MTIVDHRVLVNAPPDIIWELLGDLSATPKWHINCTQASILTTQQEGVGVRCRLNMENGPDIVQEILSWYRNLGYEYTVVDGPYKSSRGRMRLQAIPEGTIVQWTLEYELAGFAASMRDLTTKRRVNTEIEASLKRLKKLVESAGIRMDSDTRERVSMRPAPTAKERAVMAENIARTQPAMPPVNDAHSPENAPDNTGIPAIIDEGDLPSIPEPLVIDEGDLPPAPGEKLTAINEPPLDDEDTRPNHTVDEDDITLVRRPEPDETLVSVPVKPEADTAALPLEDIAEPVDTTPVEGAAADMAETETLPESQAPIELAETLLATPAVKIPAEPLAEMNTDSSEATSVESTVETPGETDIAQDEPVVEPEPQVEPTKSVFEEKLSPMGPSIWEVFGMAAPSAEDGAESAPASTVAEASTAPEEPQTTPRLQPRRRTGKHPGLSQFLQRRARTRDSL